MIRSWWAVAAGFLAAAATGGFLVGLEAGALNLIMSAPHNFDDGLALVNASRVMAAATGQFALMFLIGLILPGAPIWLFLHGRGRRSRADAVRTGIALATACALLLSLIGGILGLIIGLFIAAGLIIPAGAAGWVLHAVAYRPAARS